MDMIGHEVIRSIEIEDMNNLVFDKNVVSNLISIHEWKTDPSFLSTSSVLRDDSREAAQNQREPWRPVRGQPGRVVPPDACVHSTKIEERERHPFIPFAQISFDLGTPTCLTTK